MVVLRFRLEVQAAPVRVNVAEAAFRLSPRNRLIDLHPDNPLNQTTGLTNNAGFSVTTEHRILFNTVSAVLPIR